MEPGTEQVAERVAASGSGAVRFVRLARPTQWSKGVFVFIGPLYGWADGQEISWLSVVLAFVAFGLVSSAGYVVNDLRDREQDRLHPRKQRRPIASGAVSPGEARVFAALLYGASLVCSLGVLALAPGWAGAWMIAVVVLYALNVAAYTAKLKHIVLMDVMSLSSGFVLRVLGGCAAAAVAPSTWLLTSTLFISMFLAFGKRLGERRTMGDDAGSARGVLVGYTDDMLRMVVVATAVGTLLTYAGYVQDRADDYTLGFNLLWLTILPATFGLFRCMVLVERGDYDDPTELATGDWPFQASVALFGLMTGVLWVLQGAGYVG